MKAIVSKKQVFSRLVRVLSELQNTEKLIEEIRAAFE